MAAFALRTSSTLQPSRDERRCSFQCNRELLASCIRHGVSEFSVAKFDFRPTHRNDKRRSAGGLQLQRRSSLPDACTPCLWRIAPTIVSVIGSPIWSLIVWIIWTTYDPWGTATEGCRLPDVELRLRSVRLTLGCAPVIFSHRQSDTCSGFDVFGSKLLGSVKKPPTPAVRKERQACCQ